MKTVDDMPIRTGQVWKRRDDGREHTIASFTITQQHHESLMTVVIGFDGGEEWFGPAAMWFRMHYQPAHVYDDCATPVVIGQ